MLFGIYTAASARLLSFRLPNRGDIVPSGVFGVCLPSLLLPPILLAVFRSGDRTVEISCLLGSFSVCPPALTADFVRLYSFRLPNRGGIVTLVSCVLY